MTFLPAEPTKPQARHVTVRMAPSLLLFILMWGSLVRGLKAENVELSGTKESHTIIHHKCKGANLTLNEPTANVTVLHVFVFLGRETLASTSVPATGMFETRLTVHNNGRVTLTNLTSDDLGRYRVEVIANNKLTHNIRLIIKDKCPLKAGYMWYLEACFKLLTRDENYASAKAKCEADGAHLYDVKFPDLDKERVQFAIKQAGLSLYIDIWVGGNDLEVEGDYRWSDGTPLSSSSKLWDTGVDYDNSAAINIIVTYKHPHQQKGVTNTDVTIVHQTLYVAKSSSHGRGDVYEAQPQLIVIRMSYYWLFKWEMSFDDIYRLVFPVDNKFIHPHLNNYNLLLRLHPGI